ncbi:putative efflux protein, MATE family [Ruminococcaceae bacterium YRB3002]|nr:putative efflux protein, MATE family [Ruminococcaceae bacterium YRB3002]
MRKNIDMLNGSLWDKILLFVLPLAATTILQQLFNAADVAVVGQFVGKNAMAAVGSNGALVGLVVNLFNGVALGANVVIARFIGEGSRKDINRTVHTAIAFAVLSGIAMAVIGELLAAPVLKALGVPDEVYDMALTYLRIVVAGFPALLLYNFEAAIFRSRGDTKTPLVCLVVSGIVNVGLNLLLVIVFDMSVAGVAIATVISSVLSGAMLFVIMLKGNETFKVSLKEMTIDTRLLVKILKIGLPAGIQGSMFSIANIIIQSAVNSLGPDVMAASSAAFNIEIISYYIVNAFGQATTTFIGQNYGAGNIPRCRRVFRLSLLMDSSVTVAVSALILLFGRQLLSLFNTEPEVIDLGMIRLIAIVGFEIINGLVDSVSGAMRGFGRSLPPAVLSIIGICGLRVAWVYTVFAANPTFTVLMAAYPLSWVATSAMIFVAYGIMIKRIQNYIPVRHP